MGVENNPIIFNKDSRYLSEISDGTVDYVITSPPFNICHKYMSYHDSLNYSDFDDMYATIIRSISRVLKDDGFFVIDIADMIVMANQIVYGAECVKEKAFACGLFFLKAFPYIAIEGSDMIMKSCVSRGAKKKRFHSTCEQILVFGKQSSRRDLAEAFCLKPSYRYSTLRDSAFWPEDLVRDILEPFPLDGKILLDPFMGSGTIGRMSMAQGCRFIGYDIDERTLSLYGWV